MFSTARQFAQQAENCPPSSPFYRPGLDILRSLAFFLVFLAHGFISNVDQHTQLGAIARTGEFGVAIFFFLSAYLITELLLREKRLSGTVKIPAFYARRALRIWPLYFAMIGVCWFCGLVSPSHSLSLGWGLSLVFLVTNWYTAGHGYPPAFLYPLWSLSIEEQFYLLWPLLVKYLRPADLLKVAILFVGAAYLMLAHLLHQGRSLDPGVWVNSLVQFQFFALGTGLAVVLRGRVPGLAKASRLVFFIVGLLCLRGAQAAVYVTDPGLAHTFASIAPRFLLALGGCLCLFFSCIDFSAGRLEKPFIYLGKISYGLYVFHVLWLGVARNLMHHVAGDRMSAYAFQWTVMAIALPATILSAAVSYRYLESPFLRWKTKFTIVSSRPVEPTSNAATHWMPRPRLRAS